MEQFDDERDRQGGGNPVGYLARPEVTLLGPRVARLRRFRAGASGVPGRLSDLDALGLVAVHPALNGDLQ